MAIRQNIKNINDLTNALSRFGEPFEHFCACVASNYMSNYIWDEWYCTYNPSWYTRTYEFIDAITVSKSSSGWGVTIDARRMTAHLNKGIERGNAIFEGESGMNAHSTFGGVSVANVLPKWIDEDGISLEGWSREPIHYTDATQRYMSSNMKEIQNWYSNFGGNISDAQILADMFLPRKFK